MNVIKVNVSLDKYLIIQQKTYSLIWRCALRLLNDDNNDVVDADFLLLRHLNPASTYCVCRSAFAEMPVTNVIATAKKTMSFLNSVYSAQNGIST